MPDFNLRTNTKDFTTTKTDNETHINPDTNPRKKRLIDPRLNFDHKHGIPVTTCGDACRRLALYNSTLTERASKRSTAAWDDVHVTIIMYLYHSYANSHGNRHMYANLNTIQSVWEHHIHDRHHLHINNPISRHIAKPWKSGKSHEIKQLSPKLACYK